jgi:tight adherence protein B
MLTVITNSMLISISVCVCLGVQLLESFQTRVAAENQKANTQWPKYLDSIHSATWAGATLEQALLDSISSAPAKHSWALLEFEKDHNSGIAFNESLDNLKARLANPIADRFIEITRLASASGGRGYLNALRAQSLQLRLENSTWSEINVKQNWVLGTAKLAVLAPWLILVLLSFRPETAIAFQSESGVAVLALGTVASLLAFRLIKTLGKLPPRQRTLGV